MVEDNDKDFKESVSGFKVVGSWDNIVEHGERISYILENLDTDNYKSEIEEYNNWRPKIVEDSEDISDKTADSASINEDKIEKEKDTKDEINKAKEKASDTVTNISNVDAKEAYNDTSESAKHTYTAVRNITRKTFRKGEQAVYKNVMTKLSPYYFDNDLVSANISKKSENNFVFEVNINVDKIKKNVSNKLQDTYDDVQRKDITNNLDSSEIDKIDEEDKEEHIAAELDSDIIDEED